MTNEPLSHNIIIKVLIISLNVFYFAYIEFDFFLFGYVEVVQLICLTASIIIVCNIKQTNSKIQTLSKVLILSGIYLTLLSIHIPEVPLLNPASHIFKFFNNPDIIFLLYQIFTPFLLFILFIESLHIEKLDSKTEKQFPVILRFIIIAISLITPTLIFLHLGFHTPLTGALATSGLLTAIVGLSLQGNLSNIVSGIFLNLEKPFAPGEWITFDGQLGRVKTISWRTTRLLSIENTEISIPNDILAQSKIVNLHKNNNNYAGGGFITIDPVIVHPRHDPKYVLDLLLDSLSSASPADGRKTFGFIDAWFAGGADNGFQFWVGYDCIDRAFLLAQRSNVMLAINQILSKAGITISTGTLIQKLKSDISLNVVEEFSQKKETYFNKTNDYSSNVYFDAQSTETAFRRVSIFSPLNDQEIKKLSDGVIKKTFATDETIIKQGEFGETMFLINKGVVQITIQGADNNENIVGVLTVGDIFGEMSCLTGENRNATVKVIRPAVVYEVPKTLMSEIFENNPSIIDQLSILLENRTKENDLFIDSIRAEKLGYSELILEKLPEKIRSFFK